MRLTRVYVRFFKSFNFDYERRANEKAQRQPWEILPEGWYPHVRLDVDPQITAIVGANTPAGDPFQGSVRACRA